MYIQARTDAHASIYTDRQTETRTHRLAPRYIRMDIRQTDILIHIHMHMHRDTHTHTHTHKAIILINTCDSSLNPHRLFQNTLFMSGFQPIGKQLHHSLASVSKIIGGSRGGTPGAHPPICLAS